MNKINYYHWNLKNGLSNYTIEESELKKHLESKQEDKNNWNSILKDFKLNYNKYNQIKSNSLEILLDIYKKKYNIIRIYSPLALFFSDAHLFFELFWPYARNHTCREYYILKFESPLIIELKWSYEILIDNQNNLEKKTENKVLYLGCLSQRVPILSASINDVRESLIPYEVLIKIIKSRLRLGCDWNYLITQNVVKEEELEALIRKIVSENKPQFIEFDFEKYKNEDLIFVDIKAKGALLSKFQEIPFKKKIYNLMFKTFDIPLHEPEINIKIYPKSSTASHWTYIYSPDRYYLQHLRSVYDRENNVLEDNSPENPQLISYRLGRKTLKKRIKSLKLDFRVKILKMDHLWLSVIDKILISFTVLWFLGIFGLFFPIKPFFTKNHNIIVVSGFFDATFILIGFILLARSWFFHEGTVFKAISKRFIVILLILITLCLIFIFHQSIM